jgi:hypothetical protein
MRDRRTLVSLALVVGLIGIGGSSALGNGASFAGKLVAIHSDRFADEHATFQYGLETAQGVLALHFSGGAPTIPLATEVTVQGQRSGNAILVASGGVKTSGSTGATAPATGAKKVAVILFTFADSTSQPYTPAFAQGVAFTNSNSVAAYYSTVSWGQLSLSGDVFGWYQLRDKSTTCDYSTWASDADAAAKAAAVDLSAYDYHVYAFPTVSACGWAGLSYMPGTQAWLNGPSGMTLHAMAHELGHNLGTHHANSYYCTENGVAVSLSANVANCTSQEYGDPFSVMGNYSSLSHYEHTNFARGNLGWLKAANTLDVTSSGTYTLGAVEPPDPTGVIALRVRRDSSTYFLLELRQPSSAFDTFSSTDPAVTGVTIRIVPAYTTLAQSELVDATPSTPGYLNDAALAVGRSLYDPLSKVTFTTVAITSSGATVEVTFGSGTTQPSGPTDTTPPTAPTNLAGSHQGNKPRIALSWNAATDNVGVAEYDIYRDGVLAATVSGTMLSFTDTKVPKGTNVYYVVARDAAGNTSAPSNAVTI